MNIVNASMSAAPPGEIPSVAYFSHIALRLAVPEPVEGPPSSSKCPAIALASALISWARAYPARWMTHVSSSVAMIRRSVFWRP